jgi:hypothetical protein
MTFGDGILKFLIEFFSKSSRVEGGALVALRRERNPSCLQAPAGLGAGKSGTHSVIISAKRIPLLKILKLLRSNAADCFTKRAFCAIIMMYAHLKGA